LIEIIADGGMRLCPRGPTVLDRSMPPAVPPPRELIAIAETLCIAAVGGIGLSAAGFPGGLVSGSMLAVAIAALAGRPMKVPLALARVCFVMFTATTCYLRWVHGWDALSALLGASPGSMAQVMALAAEFEADVGGIAIVQVMRVLLILLGIPAGLALFGLMVGPTISTRGTTDASLIELAMLVTASAVAAIVLWRIRFPGGLMFGAMTGSGVLHGAGLVHSSLPWWAGSAAVLTLGAVAGARFVNVGARMLLSYLGAAFGSFAVAATVAASFALIVAALLPFRVADVTVAFAPGAQDTMMVLALAMHLDPVYVGAHHLARFLVVSFSVALVARRMARRPQARPRERWKRPGQGTFDD
jgi:membrane AbrB-like protein